MLTQRPPLYQKPPNITYHYGTAGFRLEADLMPCVSYRMGLLAAVRSIYLQGQPVGVMITASHNPEQDNGLKIIEPDGSMLDQQWEDLADEIANLQDQDQLEKFISEIISDPEFIARKKYGFVEKLSDNVNTSMACRSCSSSPTDMNQKGKIHNNINTLTNVYSDPKSTRAYHPTILVGRDTRPSGITLSQAVIEGALLLGARIQDYGQVTTPQLHFLVVRHAMFPNSEPHSINDYYKWLSAPWIQWMMSISTKSENPHNRLIIDAANGIGAVALKDLISNIEASGSIESLNTTFLHMQIINDGDGKLNYRCGADYVKSTLLPPTHVHLLSNIRYASIDGDADRLIYYYCSRNGSLAPLDGDKIAALIAMFISKKLEQAQLSTLVRVGVVQTAYANGNSTRYIEQTLGCQVAIVPTGVKHLHAKAKDFEIGIYFEANGHGTVLFQPHILDMLSQKLNQISHTEKIACEQLLLLSRMINPTVGDAISDLCAVECILASLDDEAKMNQNHPFFGPEDWDNLYNDLPNKLLKFKVKDKHLFKTLQTNEQILTKPHGLQQEIDECINFFHTKGDDSCRAFIRPSGTEDLVRIYIEANTMEYCNQLENMIMEKLKPFSMV